MSNVDSARSDYQAFARGDLATLGESSTENAIWITSDELPLGGAVDEVRERQDGAGRILHRQRQGGEAPGLRTGPTLRRSSRRGRGAAL